MRQADLASLRDMLKDHSRHIAMAVITKIELAEDRSFLKCLVNILPEELEHVARMTWEFVGDGSGVFSFPSVNDMVLVAFADGDEDLCFVIKRLSSKQDKIPIQATDGDTALISMATKRLWITSLNKIFLSKNEVVPTENLVLGQQLKTLFVDLISKIDELTLKVKDLSDKVSTHTHAGNLGYPTSAPNEAAQFVGLSGDFSGISGDFNDIKASPVQDEKILSDLAFTEKGG